MSDRPGWWLSRVEEIDGVVRACRSGKVRRLAGTNGGRPVFVVEYGEPEAALRGTANWNSALAARDPDVYFRRGERRKPVILIVAGVHGHEVEGMVAALSLIRVMESGNDLSGRARPDLRRTLEAARLLVVPLANPDGRARVPHDTLVGLTGQEMHRVGQGTRRDGSLYGWPGCKAVHPMVGDVEFLGGYYDDAGVNLMHDNWARPMSPVTSALLELVHIEGPDVAINLHSHEPPPAVLGLHYVPAETRRTLRAFAETLYRHYDEESLPHGRLPAIEEPRPEPPQALNLTGMLYHVGAALPFTFESAHGLADGARLSHEQILESHLTLFQAAASLVETATTVHTGAESKAQTEQEEP